MTKQSKSLAGMWSNLQDAWDLFLRGSGAQLIDWSKKFVGILIDIVQNHLPRWIELVVRLSDFLNQHKEVLIIVAGVLLGALTPAILAAVASFAALALTLAPFMLGGLIIGGLVAGIYWIITNWELIEKKSIEIWNRIKLFLSQIFDGIKISVKEKWDAIKQYFIDLWEGIKKTFDDAVKWITDKLQPLLNMVDKIKNGLQSFGSFTGNILSAPGKLLGFADGGIVPGPLGAPMPAIVHGGETVIPAGAGLGNINIYISGNSFLDDDAPTKMADKIIDVLKMNLRI